jgi:cell filamentation protein
VFAALAQSGALETGRRDQFISDIARFLGELNAIHAFREGNGRSQLSFIAMIGARTGFHFEFAHIERDRFLPAMIASYSGDLEPLTRELSNLLRS